MKGTPPPPGLGPVAATVAAFGVAALCVAVLALVVTTSREDRLRDRVRAACVVAAPLDLSALAALCVEAGKWDPPPDYDRPLDWGTLAPEDLDR